MGALSLREVNAALMKSRHPFMPFALLALVWLVFAAYAWLSAAQLPERMATHFGVNGVPLGG